MALTCAQGDVVQILAFAKGPTHWHLVTVQMDGYGIIQVWSKERAQRSTKSSIAWLLAMTLFMLFVVYTLWVSITRIPYACCL